MKNFLRNMTKSLTIICKEDAEFEQNLFNGFNELQELKISVKT